MILSKNVNEFDPAPANRFLPKNLKLVGYARSKLSNDDLHKKIRDYLKGDDKIKDEFLSRVSYVQGSYDGDEGFQVSIINPLSKRPPDA